MRLKCKIFDLLGTVACYRKYKNNWSFIRFIVIRIWNLVTLAALVTEFNAFIQTHFLRFWDFPYRYVSVFFICLFYCIVLSNTGFLAFHNTVQLLLIWPNAFSIIIFHYLIMQLRCLSFPACLWCRLLRVMNHKGLATCHFGACCCCCCCSLCVWNMVETRRFMSLLSN